MALGGCKSEFVGQAEALQEEACDCEKTDCRTQLRADLLALRRVARKADLSKGDKEAFRQARDEAEECLGPAEHPFAGKVRAFRDAACKCTDHSCLGDVQHMLTDISKEAADVKVNDEEKAVIEELLKAGVECLSRASL